MSETNNKQKKIKFEALMYIICGCILSMGAIHMDTINWILPQVATDLASGHSTLMVTSGFFYGMMIGHVVVGPLSDMIGCLYSWSNCRWYEWIPWRTDRSQTDSGYWWCSFFQCGTCYRW